MRRLATSIALYTAAYKRWLQIREGRTPLAQEIYGYIEGLCDTEGYARESKDVEIIAALALTFDREAVHAFARDSGFFQQLDRAQSSVDHDNATIRKLSTSK
jgi:hypothetical protein